MAANVERVFDLPFRVSSHWIFNCYILGDEEHLVFVDPGLRSNTQAALEAMHALGEEGKEVVAFCTHGHFDHLGGMPFLHQQKQARFYLPQRCQAYLAGEEARTFGIGEMLRFLPIVSQQKFSLKALREFSALEGEIGLDRKGRFEFALPVADFVSAGDCIPGLNGWELLEVPGHTDDSLCLYHAASESLLSGDAVLSLNGRAWFNPEHVDTKKSKETEEFLRSLPVRHLLPGHGEPLFGSDLWTNAISCTEKPPKKGILAGCARRFGRWPKAEFGR